MPKIYGGNDNNYNKQLNANNSINVHNYSYDDEYLIPGYNQTIKSNFYKKIYGDINICNSILIILNNNEDIKNYLNKSKRKQEITFLRFAVGYSLGNILYQSHQYLWNKEKINSKIFLTNILILLVLNLDKMTNISLILIIQNIFLILYIPKLIVNSHMQKTL